MHISISIPTKNQLTWTMRMDWEALTRVGRKCVRDRSSKICRKKLPNSNDARLSLGIAQLQMGTYVDAAQRQRHLVMPCSYVLIQTTN